MSGQYDQEALLVAVRWISADDLRRLRYRPAAAWSECCPVPQRGWRPDVAAWLAVMAAHARANPPPMREVRHD